MAIPFLNSEEFDERSHQLYDAGDYDQALELLREGLKRFPESADLHVGLGYVRLARDEFAWARASFSRALLLDTEHEDAWVGLGESLLKFGQVETALGCFARVDEFGLADDLELGLAIGRALYREGLFDESRDRLARVARANPDSAEVRAALGYTLHALGEEASSRRELRRSLRLDGDLHEARIYLSHLLFERGDARGALRELERVPPAEHWDSLSLWRTIELKCALDGCSEQAADLRPWHARLEELDEEPDAIDHLLAEVEAAFDSEDGFGAAVPSVAEPDTQIDLLAAPWQSRGVTLGDADVRVHRVSTIDGRVFTGSWEQIIARMRDVLSDPGEPISAFMTRAAERARTLTGHHLPCHDPELFLRESARIGLLRIEA